MAVNLKNPRAEQLLNELAEVTGESLTEAATHAFEERLERLKQGRARERAGLLASLNDLIAEARAQPPPTSESLKQLTDDLWGE